MSHTTILVISNLIGFIALGLWTISVQVNKKSILMKLQLIANIFYAIQYFLIGAFSAACMNLISTVRYYIYTKNEEKKKENSYFLLWSFIAIILIFAVITYTNWISMIPIIITIGYTYATWQKNTKVIRFVFLFAAVIWIGYNLYVGAFSSVLGNILELVSGFIAIFRFDTVQKKKDNIKIF